MRKLIEFLLHRMDTHPEEFLQNRKPDVKHNWVHIIKDNKKFMTDEEYKAVWEKFSEINMEQAIEDVTHKLLAPSDEVELSGFGSAPIRAEGQSVAYAMQQRYQVEQLKAQMEHQRQLMEQHVKTSVFDKAY